MAKEYHFDSEAFFEDPEGYVFTEEDIRATNAAVLEKYEQKIPMTPCEKRALRRWVSQGHSVLEAPVSKYICPLPSYMDFLDVYRMDREIAAAIKGMAPDRKEAYIKEYTGYKDSTPEELERMKAVDHTPEYVRVRYEKMAHQLFILWDYLAAEGLYNEAKEYLEEHLDDDVPPPFSFILD